MQDKDTTKSTLFQVFKLLHGEEIAKCICELGVDKYTKKLEALILYKLIAIAQVEQLSSLRDICNILSNDELGALLGIDSISAAQLSRRLRDVPPQAIRVAFQSAMRHVLAVKGADRVRQELGRVHLIDASTISLCLSRYRWAEFRSTKSGVKLHLRLLLWDSNVLPDHVVITTAKTSDKSQMDELVVTEDGALNVFDRGYVDYARFDQYCGKNVRFVTRLKESAIVEAISELSLEEDSPILKDMIVHIGDDKKRMKNPLRLIETKDSQGGRILILTNDFDLPAGQIGDIYRNRWQIELFFKWIKQHFTVKHFYGLSPEAVENQLYIALTMYCLLMLVKVETGTQQSLLAIKRLLVTCFCDPFQGFIAKLLKAPQRTSRGRRRVDHEGIFNETLRQVVAGEAEYLNDLTYDPVML